MSNVLANKLRMEGLITDNQASEGLGFSSKENITFLKAIHELGFYNEAKAISFISKKFGILTDTNAVSSMSLDVAEKLTFGFSQKYNIISYKEDETSVYFAVVDPFDRKSLENARVRLRETSKRIIPVLVNSSTMARMLAILQDGAGAVDDRESIIIDSNDLIEIDDMSETNITARVDSAPLVKLVDSIILDAYRKGASDIHIEPERNIVNIRFRVDGTLYIYKVIDKNLHDNVCSRVKIMSGLDPSNKNTPQDGSFRFKSQYILVDLRISVLPTANGEKIVIRLLGVDKDIDYDFKLLGLSPTVIDILERVIKVPNGILLVTGPTGSGKTTTLYAILNKLSTPASSIVTVEDPVERNIPGISQVQVNPKSGLSFANSLRSILRQDPDTIMVGEMRDQETAQIATRAAITGHLVLSTLHTNDTVSTIARLIDMGVEPYMISSSLKCIISQRLVKKICPNCRIEHINTDVEKQLIKIDDEMSYIGDGCQECNFTGYKGRTAVFEILELDKKTQTMISNNCKIEEIRDYVNSKNVVTMRDEVLELLSSGETTIDEAINILYMVD